MRISSKAIHRFLNVSFDESLIQFHPKDENRPELGVLNYREDIGGGFFRFSVGLEELYDLTKGLERGLAAAG